MLFFFAFHLGSYELCMVLIGLSNFPHIGNMTSYCRAIDVFCRVMDAFEADIKCAVALLI